MCKRPLLSSIIRIGYMEGKEGFLCLEDAILTIMTVADMEEADTAAQHLF